jgi:hypothetical protein
MIRYERRDERSWYIVVDGVRIGAVRRVTLSGIEPAEWKVYGMYPRFPTREEAAEAAWATHLLGSRLPVEP